MTLLRALPRPRPYPIGLAAASTFTSAVTAGDVDATWRCGH